VVRGWCRLAALSAVVVVLVVACQGGHGSGKAHSRTPAPAASSPASLASTAKTRALRAYRAMWRAYMAASRSADADDPRLARYAAGKALRVLRSSLRSLRHDGLRGGGQVDLFPTVQRLVPLGVPVVAVLGDCVDMSGTRLYRPDGGPYHVPAGRRAISATVEVLDGGVWKVTRFAIRGAGSCK